MDKLLTGAGGRYVDASISADRLKDDTCPRFYASGSNAADLQQLAAYGLDVRILGSEVGQASGIKMCYAALTKGSAALQAQLLMAAEIMGLSRAAAGGVRTQRTGSVEKDGGFYSGAASQSRRWVSEMQEIEAAFSGLGLTPLLFQGWRKCTGLWEARRWARKLRKPGTWPEPGTRPFAGWWNTCRARTSRRR